MTEIIWHKHHIIPSHDRGTDDSSNIIKVNIPMHAFLHKLLWEEHGRWQDHVAWKALSGQITFAEATILAIKKTQTGRKHTPEHRAKILSKQIGSKRNDSTKAKISIANKGRKLSDNHKEILSKTHKGKHLSDEHKNTLSITHKGKPKSEAQKEKMRISAKLLWEKRRQNFI